jgi:hypothetical protein
MHGGGGGGVRQSTSANARRAVVTELMCFVYLFNTIDVLFCHSPSDVLN